MFIISNYDDQGLPCSPVVKTRLPVQGGAGLIPGPGA